jgi:hypothetical protein
VTRCELPDDTRETSTARKVRAGGFWLWIDNYHPLRFPLDAAQTAQALNPNSSSRLGASTHTSSPPAVSRKGRKALMQSRADRRIWCRIGLAF